MCADCINPSPQLDARIDATRRWLDQHQATLLAFLDNLVEDDIDALLDKRDQVPFDTAWVAADTIAQAFILALSDDDAGTLEK